MRIKYAAAIGLVLSLIISGPARADEKWQAVGGHRFKKLSAEGYGNCIFSTSEIVRDGEFKVKIQDIFTKPDQVYARCYFPEPVGRIEAADFWHEIWIDGLIAKRIVFGEPPAPNADQTAIWITAEDYADEMAALKPGRHEIVLWIMMNARNESGKIKWIPRRLSKGEFIYEVK